jgi:undecaprenyl-diphosphatase
LAICAINRCGGNIAADPVVIGRSVDYQQRRMDGAGHANPQQRWLVAWGIGCIVVFCFAAACDQTVAQRVHDTGLPVWIHAHATLRWWLRLPGNFFFAFLAACVLAVDLVRRGTAKSLPSWRGVLIVLLSAAYSSVNAIFKLAIGRSRPMHGDPPFALHPFRDGWFHWIGVDNLSFPSGDVCCAFATAGALTMVAPRGWAVWFALGMWIIVERVAENAHYPSDTVAGAILGLACAGWARWTIDHWLERRGGRGVSKQDSQPVPPRPSRDDFTSVSQP